MTVDNNELAEALVRANKRIDDLEARLKGIENNADFRQLSYIHGVLKRVLNVNNIRSLFHTEVLRAAGLINESALADAEAKAKARYVEKPGYSIEPATADQQLQSVKSEYAGEYKSVGDFKTPGA